MNPTDLGLSQAPSTRKVYVLCLQRANAKAFLWFALLGSLLLASCVHVKGTGFQATFVATDASGVRISAESAAFESLTQSKSVEAAERAVGTWTRLKGWFGLGKAATSELGDLGRQLTE